MAFRCEFDRSRRALLIFVEGTVNLREAVKMIIDTVGDGRFDPRYDAFVDSMGARCVGPVRGAWVVAELLKRSHQDFETRIAITTSDSDLYELGRLSSVGLSEPGDPLMEIFPSRHEARQWLIAN